MNEHPIQGLMTTAMDSLKEMIDVNTIVGEPVESPDGSIIIPVSRVGFGFAAGGSEFKAKNGGQQSQDGQSQEQSEEELPFGGGSGGGVSITPIAFLVVRKQGVQMIHLNEQTHLYERMLDLAPPVIEKIQELLQKGGNSSSQQQSRRPSSDLL
ncbi:sporulation protein YtfJ [Thalassobacillus cyri]|uniref:Sporulation protein YtfJ n=1 Tax=Thalassobacillus cyri TaxID=571932 RepID=A0A1H4BJI1_9BACI|nr:GerW family sporulation protein [Thalassobacillus cyri]SEA48355.1 sporulation protein YtfJ [Thalassobacillus cyri]